MNHSNGLIVMGAVRNKATRNTMPVSTITSKGQTTIPKEIRDLLRLAAGDRVEFIVEGKNRIVLRPASADIKELSGMLHDPSRAPVSLEEMDSAIAGTQT